MSNRNNQNAPASPLSTIVALSRHYGRDDEWIIAGGGNTSAKTDGTLWVKASGTSLGTATEENFVALDRTRLAEIWNKEYPRDVEQREAEALTDLMAARHGGETLRPSVETGMHDALPHTYVVHTHPTLVNGVTCGRDGPAVVKELFEERAEWVGAINPGYVLSKHIVDTVARRKVTADAPAPYIFLQNHGLTVAAEDPDEIHRIHQQIVTALLARIERVPDMRIFDVDLTAADRLRRQIIEVFTESTGTTPVVLFEAVGEAISRAANGETVAPLLRPCSPDHIVYAGPRPLYVAEEAEIAAQFREYAADGAPPSIVLVRGLGFFAVGTSHKAADTARMLFRDALKIAAYAENFGGPRGMDDDQIEFIRGWEVERFRAEVNLDQS
ncbi:MAG: class II aldolase/adducin family protein [Spirochaeta sp.]|jgi:rhamnose utilization protein RhaD (predicted bifunctional aldolase and dehydrogenase)|nr:class II aldolase/adducin family protein [Spirochaeta sp.]